jgi:hypothetical protein
MGGFSSGAEAEEFFADKVEKPILLLTIGRALVLKAPPAQRPLNSYRP